MRLSGRAVAAAALTIGFAAGVWTGLAGPVGATGRATPVDGSWRDAGGHAFQLAGSLEGGFTVTAAATWTINKVCTLQQGTVVEKFTPLGGGKFEIRWLNVWVPMNPEAPGAKCEFVFDGGPATVTVGATAKAITISNCGGACSVTGTTLTRTSVPTTTVKPTTTATPATGKLVVTLYGMPNRYGGDANKDGLIDMATTPQQVSPSEWSASVYVHRPSADCDAGATYSWQVDGRIAELEATKTKCVYTYSHFKGLGRHRVAVAAANGSVRESGSGVVTLKDFLVVGLGDSNASGEGNPDNPSSGVAWIDQRCDRSHFGYQAQTAAVLEHASDDTSVTFVHLACSGAGVDVGMLHGYRGINDPGADAGPLAPQIAQLKALISGPKTDGVAWRIPDVVILSIGVNDLHFGDVISQCVWEKSCFNSKGLRGARAGETVDQAITRWQKALPTLYTRLAKALAGLRIPANRVYITQYFDSLRDNRGAICNPLIGPGHPGWSFTKPEAEWAYRDFLVPLNKAVAATAKHGWHVVPAPTGFLKRGYCATPSWIVPISSSSWNQRDFNGTMHANLLGHQAQRLNVLAALKRSGIDGKP
jgi:lysophospholipase L1-like esterase